MHRNHRLNNRRQSSARGLRLESLERRVCLAGELLALELNLRDAADDAITTPTDRVADVAVGELVYLEVSYRDLREGDERDGVFSMVTDVVSSSSALQPVVTETQAVVVNRAIQNAASGTISFALENASESVSFSLTDFTDRRGLAIRDALIGLGLEADDFTVQRVADNSVILPGQSDPPSPANWVFEIRYAPEFDGVDMADVQVVVNSDTTIAAGVVSFAPRFNDGSLNPEAVEKNLDVRSRSVPGATNFGEEVYREFFRNSFQNDSRFVTDIIGPLIGGGIPEAFQLDVLPSPFDAFSIPVRVTEPIDDLRIELTLDSAANDSDAILLYGTAEGLSPDLVILDEQSVLTINASQSNRPPVVDGPLVIELTEDDSSQEFDLLVGASDPDGDSLVVSSLNLVSGDASGITFDAVTNRLLVNPNAYNSLVSNQVESVVFESEISDGMGGSVSRQVTVAIEGINDPPFALDDAVAIVGTTPTRIDVLANDFDSDSSDLFLVITDPTAFGTLTLTADGQVEYLPFPGFVGLDTFVYSISDGESSSSATVSITVEPPPAVPVQVISVDDISTVAATGGIFQVPVGYQTLNADGAPAALASTLLDFNLHFDSSQVEFLGFADGSEFQEGRIASTLDDEINVGVSDGDPATDKIIRTSFTDQDALQMPGWPNQPTDGVLGLFTAQFRILATEGQSTIRFTANQNGNVVGEAAAFGFRGDPFAIQFVEATPDVDGDNDFDGNDAFLFHLVMLGGTNTQIDLFKGASPLLAADVRDRIGTLAASQLLDLDRDGSTDGNDSFLTQIIVLGATDEQIDLFKGVSDITAAEMRTRVETLSVGGGNTGSGAAFAASASPSPAQRVRSSGTERAVFAGDEIEIPVLYQTLDVNGDPASLKT
ncbi:MAG: Ig-like domain-containing protein, partial [Planctomycetota bacterium]